MDASADYEPAENPGQNPGGVLQPPAWADFVMTLDEWLHRTNLRVKLVVETDDGHQIMSQYVPGVFKWGQTVSINAVLEARMS